MDQSSDLRTCRRLRFSPGTTDSLETNTAHNFAAKHALEIYGSDAIYTFIPKNGCSTLRYSIAQSNGVIGGPADINWIHANNMTFRASLRSLVTARYTFAVLRCPFRRLSSVFLDKAVKQEKPMRMLQRNHEYHIPALPRWRARMDRRWLRKLGRHQTYPDMTFRTFLDRLAEPGGCATDHHWMPQTAFLIYKDYDDLFCLEDFDTAITQLNNRIGLVVEDARSLTGHGIDNKQQKNDKCFADTPVCELAETNAAGLVPSPSALFDDALIAATRTLYRDDLDLYQARFGDKALLFH